MNEIIDSRKEEDQKENRGNGSKIVKMDIN